MPASGLCMHIHGCPPEYIYSIPPTHNSKTTDIKIKVYLCFGAPQALLFPLCILEAKLRCDRCYSLGSLCDHTRRGQTVEPESILRCRAEVSIYPNTPISEGFREETWCS